MQASDVGHLAAPSGDVPFGVHSGQVGVPAPRAEGSAHTPGPYSVWRRQHGATGWIKTTHTLKARSDRDAQARLRRRFAGAGFSSMSLVAVPPGIDPNAAATGERA